MDEMKKKNSLKGAFQNPNDSGRSVLQVGTLRPRLIHDYDSTQLLSNSAGDTNLCTPARIYSLFRNAELVPHIVHYASGLLDRLHVSTL